MEPDHVLHTLLQHAATERRVQSARVIKLRPLSGGSINRVYRAELSSGRSIVFKWHPNPPARFFACEDDGLSLLRSANAIRVPQVYSVAEQGIVMEWLEEGVAESNQRDPGLQLGEGLVRQHMVTAQAYGYAHDNFVGLLPQANQPTDQWIPFFRDQRLRPQLALAERLGRMNRERRKRSERLLGRLGEWIDENNVRPALLHGDLWGGNWLQTRQGPAVIDPAVYYGDREMDLAMAALFGGFPRAFFDAYHAAYPLAPGHTERRPLYQLYYLLIHLNIFGESYGRQVDQVLRKYGS